MLATGTVKAAVAAVLLVLGLGRRNVLQAIEAEVRVHFVAQAETASGGNKVGVVSMVGCGWMDGGLRE